MASLPIHPDNEANTACSEKLTLLADEITTLASRLRRNFGPQTGQTGERDRPAGFSAKAARILKARRKADELAGLEGFSASPALDCLLDLYIQVSAGRTVSVTSACIGASCPLTTALRWIHCLEKMHLIERSPDPFDNRRTHVTLTDKGAAVIEEVIVLY